MIRRYPPPRFTIWNLRGSSGGDTLSRSMSSSVFGQTLDNGKAVLAAKWYLRCATRVGPRARIWGHPVIKNDGNLVIGERVRLVSTIATLEMSVGRGGTLELGDNVFINYGCSIAATQQIRIGSHCAIGTHAIIMDNDFHRIEPERRFETPPSAPITLENNVWLGARVIILRGTTIGEGSVIGAGSVVSGNIPPRSLAAGVPAKVIRKL